jgi:hypothetical protein
LHKLPFGVWSYKIFEKAHATSVTLKGNEGKLMSSFKKGRFVRWKTDCTGKIE